VGVCFFVNIGGPFFEESTAPEMNLPDIREADATRLALRFVCRQMYDTYLAQVAEARNAVSIEKQSYEPQLPVLDREEIENESEEDLLRSKINKMQEELMQLTVVTKETETKHKAKVKGKLIRLENARAERDRQKRQCEQVTTVIEQLQIANSQESNSSPDDIHRLTSDIERLQLHIVQMRRDIEEFDAHVRENIGQQVYIQISNGPLVVKTELHQ
jgi:chromosome segregation ATPase